MKVVVWGFNVLRYCPVKFEFKYQMRDSKGNISSLAKDTEEKDLGILFQENLKFDKQIERKCRQSQHNSWTNQTRFCTHGL